MSDSLTPKERAEAWDREDPVELRRSADEWSDLGHVDYAAYLRAWADYREGGSPPKSHVQRPDRWL